MIHSQTNLPAGRAKLASVIRSAGDVVCIDDAATAMNLSRTEAAKALSRWAKQGWLRRVGKGTYVPVSLDMLTAAHVVDDAWILVPALFAPAYIAGRTAAEYWGLTEQIFRDILIFTAQTVRKKTVETGGTFFSLKHISEKMIFGTKTVWRGTSKVFVSDPHRTIIDMLDDPTIGGGIRHVADCFANYVQRPDFTPAKLIAYGDRRGNGAVFKRLGFLAEHHPDAAILANLCKDRLTKGHAKLDPTLTSPRLVTRWRLRIPDNWRKGPPP